MPGGQDHKPAGLPRLPITVFILPILLRAVELFVPVRLLWRLGMEAQVEDWGRNWVIDGSLDADLAFIEYWVTHHEII